MNPWELWRVVCRRWGERVWWHMMCVGKIFFFWKSWVRRGSNRKTVFLILCVLWTNPLEREREAAAFLVFSHSHVIQNQVWTPVSCKIYRATLQPPPNIYPSSSPHSLTQLIEKIWQLFFSWDLNSNSNTVFQKPLSQQTSHPIYTNRKFKEKNGRGSTNTGTRVLGLESEYSKDKLFG